MATLSRVNNYHLVANNIAPTPLISSVHACVLAVTKIADKYSWRQWVYHSGNHAVDISVRVLETKYHTGQPDPKRLQLYHKCLPSAS